MARQPTDHPPKRLPKAAKPKHTITALKLLVTPVFAVRNEKGEVIDELPAQKEGGGPFQFYAPDFDKVAEKVNELLPQVEQMFKAQQNGSGPE